MIDAADVVVANLTAFKGVDADPGTAWEVGYGAAKGKLLMGYTATPEPIDARDARLAAENPTPGDLFPMSETTPEPFGHPTNLMIAESIRAWGGDVVLGPAGSFDDVAAFERCIALLARRLQGRANNADSS